MSLELKVNGMTCDHCKSKVEVALKSLPGVGDVHVYLDEGMVEITGDGVVAKAAVKAIEAAGYEAEVVDE